LNNLKLTGSIGVLLRAKKEGYPILIKEALQRMQNKGIWLGQGVIDFAIKETGENNKT